uniref:Uncharacterized protein LOC111117363 isoform X1 n=1 Tax=Crassostrea virginica TaxID=6565 RepID=A0A8B8CBV7_CRAVI|nr:uncharacterized protein LOC111117363 isoform X1 [Crassostrea virginica]XP_022312167.1 uncharacterized protein LOC111117363 isoform X1 [Crassostrea virginica]
MPHVSVLWENSNATMWQQHYCLALHWILSKEPEIEALPVPIVEDLLLCQEYLTAKEPLSWLRQQLIVSPDKVIQTAFLTSGQRENATWAAVRKHRFTASNFGPIIAAAKRNRLTISLKKRLLSAYNLEKRAPIQWGITHESVAIEEYCKEGGVTVLPTGIWLHETGVLGASPDGFVQGIFKDSLNVYVQHPKIKMLPDIVEVKCPFSAKDLTIPDACRSIKDFFLVKEEDGSIALKRTHDYWHQIQGQLHLSGTQCCDLVIWTQVDLKIVRILKDNTWAQNISAMLDFYFSVFLPSLSE